MTGIRRYAVVGAGSRAGLYIDAILDEHAGSAALVAIVEPNPHRQDLYLRRVAGAGAPPPSVWQP